MAYSRGRYGLGSFGTALTGGSTTTSYTGSNVTTQGLARRQGETTIPYEFYVISQAGLYRGGAITASYEIASTVSGQKRASGSVSASYDFDTATSGSEVYYTTSGYGRGRYGFGEFGMGFTIAVTSVGMEMVGSTVTSGSHGSTTSVPSTMVGDNVGRGSRGSTTTTAFDVRIDAQGVRRMGGATVIPGVPDYVTISQGHRVYRGDTVTTYSMDAVSRGILPFWAPESRMVQVPEITNWLQVPAVSRWVTVPAREGGLTVPAVSTTQTVGVDV